MSFFRKSDGIHFKSEVFFKIADIIMVGVYKVGFDLVGQYGVCRIHSGP